MSPRHPWTILYADDDPDDRFLAERAVRETGLDAELMLVEDGQEALDYLAGRGPFAGTPRPALILLDLNMPRRDGLATLKAIKADATLRRIPVVILTTSGAQRHVAASYDHGANTYIVKPTTGAALVTIFRALHHYWRDTATLVEEGA